jgi:hypothetical protein
MSPEDIMLKEVEIEIDLDIPSKNELILLAIASMEDKQKQIIADARLESAKIQTKINQLMCIEHQT